MTIGASNVSFGSISAELGIGNSNLSLMDLSVEQMKMDIASGTSASSQYGTFTLTMSHGGHNIGRNGSTVTSAQGQGVNGLNAAPFAMSEWVGFDPGDATYRPTNSTASIFMGTSTNNPNALTIDQGFGTGQCFVNSACTNNVYCTKSGSTITIYVQETTESEGFVSYGGATTVYNNTTATAISGSQAIGTITAGTGQSVPTACTMSYSTLTSTGSGGFFGSGLHVATVPSGSTGTTNLGATKIGYKIRSGGISEAGPGTSGYAIAHVLVHFDFYGVSGVTNSASAPMRVSIGLRQSSYADHGSGFQSC